MNEKEQAVFSAIVRAETDFSQCAFLDGLLKHNTRHLAPVHDRVATRALCRLWRNN